MLRKKLSRLLPVGVLMLASGLLLHNFVHLPKTEFIAGLLIGMSAVFMIAAWIGRLGADSKGLR